MDEAYVPTEHPETGEDPRVPQAHVDKGRPGGHPIPESERTSSPLGLTAALSTNRPRRRAVGRVRSRAIFEAVRTSGAVGGTRPVVVRFVRQTSWSEPRVAYAISRRVGRAVVRNRVRRRLRAIMTELAPSLPAGAYLVHVGPDGPTLTYDDLKVAMSGALERATRTPPGSRRAAVARDGGPS